MPSFRLNRRTFLRGLGGVAIALPALEIMRAPETQHVSAQSPATPGRFVLAYGGVSTGADRTTDDLLRPTATGPGYEIRRATRSLEELGIHDEVTLVTGLVLPYQEGEGAVPPGGRSRFYHYNTGGPQASGVRGPAERDWEPRGPTADHIVAAELGEGRRFPVLAYRVQPRSYVGTSSIGSSGRFSFYRDGDGGIRAQDPIVSPRVAFESLFTGFVPTDPEAARRAAIRIERRQSVLDVVREDARSLVGRLGGADRQRLERHFEEIRGLEERLAAVMPMGSQCALIPDPGDDPPIGETIIEYRGEGMGYTTTGGYSNEDRRAEIMADLIAMAFSCDLSRASSLMISEAKCYMNMYPLSEARYEFDVHAGTHNANQGAVSDAVSWHAKQWGRLVRKLADTPEIDGSTLLDHTALVLLFEGGWGFNPESTSDAGGRTSSHSTENMTVFVAGGAGGLKRGHHISAPGANPASVVLSGMRAIGYEGDSLGDVTEVIPELFV